jgi:hypothetical protein
MRQIQSQADFALQHVAQGAVADRDGRWRAG